MIYPGFCLVISGPSGVGKSTICAEIIKEFDDVSLSVSCTTRQPRPGEVNGKDYTFLTRDEFETRIKNNLFLEHAEVFGNLYGSPVPQLKQGNVVLFDIDWQGLVQLQARNVDHVSIFLMPPSIENLKLRLQSRGQDSPETIQKRLSIAQFEIDQSRIYHHIITNDNLSHCLFQVKQILLQSKHSRLS